MKNANFLLVGVGGQGILTASDILSQVGLQADYDVKKSEVHGMAQRGGTVISHVRFGQTVYSPLIATGEADFVLAFEMLEAMRWIHFLHPQGTVLANQQRLPPIAVTSGGGNYPPQEEMRQQLQQYAKQIHLIDGLQIAQELGNVRVVNTVLLGALSALLPIPLQKWEEIIAQQFRSKYVEINRQALRAGRAQAEDE